MATIITATLMAVAATASLMMKRENVFCRLKAILFAMKTDMFKWHTFGILQMYFI
jgi:hypothetical protein